MNKLKHKFVDTIPDNLERGIIYVSLGYKTVTHQCPCGCKSEVVTPLSPHDWKITFNGENVSLYPSVGSWSLPCQSHYWIKNNEIVWAEKWSKERIQTNRRFDKEDRQEQKKTSFWDIFNF